MIRHLSAFALAVSLALPAAAHQDSAKDRVDYRQGAYRVMGWHMGLLGAVAQGKQPFDTKSVRQWARNLQWAERLTATAYTADTRKVKASRMKASAWQDLDGFRSRGKELKLAVDELVRLAGGEDESAIKAAIGEVGKGCKACHDDYREAIDDH